MGKRGAAVFRSLVFVLLFCVLFALIQDMFLVKTGENFWLQEGFFEEPKNSLDVVYIGASPTFTSWSTPIAYKKYGITSWTYANNSQPFDAVQSFLKLARERQPNAVYMICVNGLGSAGDLTVEQLHSTSDHFRPSFEKLKLIDRICSDFQSTPEEYLELLFPIVRYHSRWSTLNLYSFHSVFDEYKGACQGSPYFTVTDISQSKVVTDKRDPLPTVTESTLDALLDFCAQENIKAVFVLSAQYRDEQMLQWYNTLVDEIEARGFPVANEIADLDAIGLDDTSDFYNINHTNIHGALKITDYLSRYLLEHYDFPDKPGGCYESWDEAYTKYKDIITPYLTEEELSRLP